MLRKFESEYKGFHSNRRIGKIFEHQSELEGTLLSGALFIFAKWLTSILSVL